METSETDWILKNLPPFHEINLRGEVDYYGTSHIIASKLKKNYHLEVSLHGLMAGCSLKSSAWWG